MNDLLTKKDFVKVGYVGGLFGYEGDLRFVSGEAILEGLDDKLRFLFFIENGMYVPRFVHSLDEDQGLIRFQRFLSREEARQLTDQDVFLRHRDLPQNTTESGERGVQWFQLPGYTIFDCETDAIVGVIDSVREYPAGLMAEVQAKDRSDMILIPLADPLIRDIDPHEKHLFMDLPEGLLDL